jgi:starvation-inducible DNA-binding protein
METLVELMKKTLADTFCLYLKTHNFHWNVEGSKFVELHGYFGDLYDELHDSIDPMAEHLRTLDSYVPGSLKRFLEMSEVLDEENIPEALQMVRILQADNETVLKTLNLTMKFALKEEKQGLANFLADRIDVHEKHNWMLKSIIK